MFEHRIETTAHLSGAAHEVWAVLTDFSSYGDWNPFIISLSGTPAEGERLEATFLQANGKESQFKPIVLRVSPARQLRWLGKLGPGGLFDGEHYFVLKPAEDGGTDLVHGERFTGLLVPAMKGLLADTAKGFTSMNEALEERVKSVR
ncbi:SRPBCC domain-containing protein [Glycomyces buryatensis]|uniref:SRPBCC domain-containing protein n=2 Tax=Glycomyces buryatensis TaxID=2570927 RepID=A0A4S8QFM6_9ACTN|nr:SRPBCC domain-containing protein [Glycomyces buryatensis]